jgi:hypothetical protein
MAGIKQVYQSIIAEIKNNTQEFPFVHIWNNQLNQLAEAQTYAFPFPNCFVEIVAPTDYMPLLEGCSVGDLTVRIHIGHEEYDAFDGNFEENVNVFDLRGSIIRILNNFQPTSCSSLMKSSESQDFIHTNIYHYIVEFKCAFIDDTGSYENQHTFVTAIIDDVIVPPQIAPTIETIFDFQFDGSFN